MKKHVKKLLVLILALVLCTGSALAAQPEGTRTDYTTDRSGTTPFDQTFDSYSVVTYFTSGDGQDQIFGRFYYPADFDSSKTYPTILMAHGAGINCDIYDTYYAPAMAEAGYVCYAYDVRGVDGEYGASRSTNNAGRAPDLETYVTEANTALDFIQAQPYVDNDHIYMWGQSMGAMTTELITAKRGSELAGTILLYGAAGEERLNANGATVEELQAFEGEVLLVLGADDPLATADGFVAEMAYYQNSSFLYISDANHGFGYMADRPTQITTEAVLDFLDRAENITLPAPFTPDSMNAFHETPDTASAGMDPLDAGYRANFDGGAYSVVTWVPSTDGLDQIYSRIYYPANFDPSKTYPTIVMAHGANINSDNAYNAYYAPYMASHGYICIAHDVRGVQGEYGDSRSTNNAGRAPDLDTYVADGLAIIDYIKTQPYVDTENFFMWGQSMGAATTQRITSQRPDQFKATLLLYGAAQDLTDIQANHKGEALFVLDAEDPLIDYTGAIASSKYYTGGSTVMYISGASHGFGYLMERPTVITAQTALDFFDRIQETPAPTPAPSQPETPTAPSAIPDNTPATGEISYLALYVICAAVSLCSIFALAMPAIKKRLGR